MHSGNWISIEDLLISEGIVSVIQRVKKDGVRISSNNETQFDFTTEDNDESDLSSKGYVLSNLKLRASFEIEQASIHPKERQPPPWESDPSFMLWNYGWLESDFSENLPNTSIPQSPKLTCIGDAIKMGLWHEGRKDPWREFITMAVDDFLQKTNQMPTNPDIWSALSKKYPSTSKQINLDTNWPLTRKNFNDRWRRYTKKD